MSAPAALVVDDDPLVRASLADVLGDLWLGVLEADGLRQALLFLQERPIALVVSDVDMPDGSGFELLALVRRLSVSIPVVLLSARCDTLLEGEARRSGAAALFPKPVPIDPLRSLVRRLLNV